MATGCAGYADTLQCLRTVSPEKYRQAMDLSPSGLSYGGMRFVYQPSYDDNFFTAPPQHVLRAGNYSKIPRFLLNTVGSSLPTWSFLYVRQKALPFLGSFHGSDFVLETGVGPAPGVDNDYIDPLINFVVALDPNTPNGRPEAVSSIITWPKWTPGGALYTFVDSESNLAESAQSDSSASSVATKATHTPPSGVVISKDNFRVAAIEAMNALFYKYPF
ncbi:hypothetical protein RQP46_009446 [Phenoliferia psychrophenolica]